MAQDKRSYLDRARKWLESPTVEAIRYAALDLRVVMEMLTYEKLRAAESNIPAAVLETWQPPQAIKALLEFDTMADQSFDLSIGTHRPGSSDPEEWLSLGNHHALSLKWLKKNYNKVGNLLHAPSARNTEDIDAAKCAGDLREVAIELDKALTSGIAVATWGGGVTFNCGSCGKLIVRNAEALRAGATASCSTQGCDADYKLVQIENGDSLMQRLQFAIECKGCQAKIAVDHRKVREGYCFNCAMCKQGHRITGARTTWAYEKVE